MFNRLRSICSRRLSLCLLLAVTWTASAAEDFSLPVLKGLWLALAEQGGRLLVAGERGRVAWSDDGQHWQRVQLPTEQGLTALCTTERRYWLASQGGELFESRDRGQSWQRHATGESGPLFALDCSNDRVLAVGAYGRLVRWTPTGLDSRALTELEDSELGIPHLYQIQRQQQRLILIGEAGLLAFSDDDGQHWQRQPSPYQGSWFALAQAEDRLWLAGLNGHVYSRTADGRWQPLKPGPEQSLFSLTLIDGKPLMGGNSGQLWWRNQPLAGHYPGVITDLLRHAGRLWVAGDQGLVYRDWR